MKIKINTKSGGAVMTVVPAKEVNIEIAPEDWKEAKFSVADLAIKAIQESLK